MIYLNHSDIYLSSEIISGLYYKSKYNRQLYFLVTCEIKGEENALVTVYVFDGDQHSGALENTTEIALPKGDVTTWLEIDIWPKYYYPKFHNERTQWYHDFNKDNTESYPFALADVMQFALDLGVKEGNIQLR